MKAAHAALSDSEHPEIEAKMAGEWSNDETFMKEIHPAHAIWRHDEDTAMAKAALTHTRLAWPILWSESGWGYYTHSST